MISNCFTIISKINNIRSNKNKVVNTTFLSCPYFKNHINNYIALSNQKSFEIYSKYNTNIFPKFSVLELNKNKNKKIETNICQKNIIPIYFFIGCYYIFLAYFPKILNYNLYIFNII